MRGLIRAALAAGLMLALLGCQTAAEAPDAAPVKSAALAPVTILSLPPPADAQTSSAEDAHLTELAARGELDEKTAAEYVKRRKAGECPDMNTAGVPEETLKQAGCGQDGQEGIR